MEPGDIGCRQRFVAVIAGGDQQTHAGAVGDSYEVGRRKVEGSLETGIFPFILFPLPSPGTVPGGNSGLTDVSSRGTQTLMRYPGRTQVGNM